MKIVRLNYKYLVYSLCVSIILSIILPLTTYFLFIEEFSLTLTQSASPLIISCLILFVLIYGILCLLPAKIVNGVALLFLLGLLFCYYNYYFIDYQGRVIGVDHNTFDLNYSRWEYLAFLLVTSVALLFSNKLIKHLPILFWALLLIWVSNFIIIFIQHNKHAINISQTIESDEEFYRFSRDQNIVHIILDGMQGSVFSQILEQNQAMVNQFEGFTFFPDALTPSQISYLAIPAILSGLAFDGNGSILEYRKRSGMISQENGSDTSSPPLLFNMLNQAGFQLDLLASPGSGMEILPLYNRFHYTDLESEGSNSRGLRRLIDLTLIKALPWSIKRKIYSQGRWFFSAEEVNILPRANRALLFLQTLGDKIKLDSQYKKYKLLHLLTPHQPYTTDQNCDPISPFSGVEASYLQSRCSMLTIIELLNKLKAMEVYDNSLIIINGDHGICSDYNMPTKVENDSLPNCIGNANPLVLVKKPNSRAPFAISSRQISTTDIPVSVLDLSSIPNTLSGTSMFSKIDPGNRSRRFFQFEPNRVLASKLDRFDTVITYEIDGDLRHSDSWKKASNTNQINFDQLKYGKIIEIEKSGVSSAGAWVRWKGAAPARHIYIMYGDKRLILKSNQRFFSFKLPASFGDEKLHLVDPVAGVKQEFKLQM